jgi:hypothetical protein
VVVVVFKRLDDVKDTIDELDMVKTRLNGSSYFKELCIQNWQISPAIPPSEIIWPNMNKMNEQTTFKTLQHILVPILVSIFAIFAILGAETAGVHLLPKSIVPIFSYLTLTCYVLYNIYATPMLVFNGIQSEAHHVKSRRESAYNSRLVTTLIFNLLISPITYSLFISRNIPSLLQDRQAMDENTVIRLGIPHFTNTLY